MGLKGDWGKIKALFSRQKKTLQEDKDDILTEVGKQVSATMRRRISSGQIEGPPLKPETVKAKVRKGQHTFPLIATGQYVKSFGVLMLGGDKIVIGPQGERNKKIGAYLEFGTQHMPARPHIRPALVELNKIMPRILRDRGFTYTGKK